MPVTVGVFINPGRRGSDGPLQKTPRTEAIAVSNTIPGGDYARFLVDELLPYVTNKFGLNLSPDPELRAIAGMSSGAICAWTVAWSA